MTAVTVHSDFAAQENKICHCFHFFPFYSPSSDGTGCHDLSFWMLIFKPAFSFSSFTLIKKLFSYSSLSALSWCHLHIWGCWYFSPQSWPAGDSSSLAFHMMYSPYKIKKQGDKIQPHLTHLNWESESKSRSIVSSSLRLHRSYSPRNAPGQNTGVSSLSFL